MSKLEMTVACDLTGSELQERRNTVLRRISGFVQQIQELESGYAYRLPAGEQQLLEVTQMISLERRCCPFLSFVLKVEAGDDAAWLEISGPEGTKDFLARMFEVNQLPA